MGKKKSSMAKLFVNRSSITNTTHATSMLADPTGYLAARGLSLLSKPTGYLAARGVL